MTSVTIEWPTGPVQLEWRAECSTDLPITGSHGFCFGNSGVFVVNVRSRGLTIPGGHIEDSETPLDCLIREVQEEACLNLDRIVQIGILISDHSANANYAGPYPIRAAQAIFAARVSEIREFVQTTEVDDRIELSSEELPTSHHEWNVVLDAAFREALRVFSTATVK